MKLLFILLFSAMTALAQTPEWSRKYHAGSVTCLDFSGDGGKLLSGGADRRVYLWNTNSGDSAKSFKSINNRPDNVDFNIDGSWFIISYVNGAHRTAFLYTSKDSVFKDIVNTVNPFQSHEYKWKGNAYSNYAFLSNNDSTLINLLSGQIIFGPGASDEGWITSENIVTNTSLLVFSKLSTFGQFSLSSDKKAVHCSGYWSWGQKNNGVVSSEKGWGNYYIDLTNKTLTQIGYVGKSITTVTFSSDRKHTLLGTDKGSIYITETPQFLVIDSLCTTTSPATALATDMQGRYYFSAHEDSTLRIWTPGVHNIFKKPCDDDCCFAGFPAFCHSPHGRDSGAVEY